MENLFVPLVILSQVLALFILIFLAIWTGDVLGGFAWDASVKQFNCHPLLMIIGLVFINGDSILMFRLFPSLDKSKVKIIHLTLQGTAVILGAVGLAAVFGNTNAIGGANLHSMHSWIGLSTYLMFALQWICGFVILFFPKLGDYFRSIYMPVHRYFGVAIFSMAIVAAIAGIQENLTFYPPPDNNFTRIQLIGNFLGVFIVAFALVVGYLVTNSLYMRRPEPQDQTDGERQTIGESNPTYKSYSFLH